MKNLQLNIFKIKDDVNINELKGKILNSLTNVYTSNTFKQTEIMNDAEYELEFIFYMKKTERKRIDWYERIKEIFDVDDEKLKDIYSAYGILIITGEGIRYVFSFGRAVSAIEDYIDWDFGLEMASRMLDRNSINAQSSKYFSFSKNKSLVVYNANSFNTEVGESVDLITANIKENNRMGNITSLLEYINSKVVFSSGIKVVVKKDEINPIDFIQIVHDINSIYKQYPEVIVIPKLKFIKKDDEIIGVLKDRLNVELLNSTNDAGISICLYTVLNSDIILFEDVEKYTLSYYRNSQEYNTIVSNDITEFMKKYLISDVEKIQLKICTSTGDMNFSLYKMLDYTVELENDGNYYCLYNGKWAKFNQNYVKKVNDEISLINEIAEYNDEYNLINNYNDDAISKYGIEMLKYLNIEPPILNDKNKEKLYREFVYNYIISKKKRGLLCDRKSIEQIEICDVYCDNELIHTKIGTPGNFNEGINQSIRGIEFWNSNKTKVKNELRIDQVIGATLILLTDNKSVISEKDINRFKSLRFKLNLIDWKNKVEGMNKKIKVIIAKS